MKRLDESTLEALAECICGSGTGAGGGYTRPGPYRTMGQIHDFFRRAGIRPVGTSSTRKWFVLESLEAVDGSGHLEHVLRRLASPKEYHGDAELTTSVIEHLNQILIVEGLELSLQGVDANVQAIEAAVAPSRPKHRSGDDVPDFARLVADSTLADILTFRWQEAQRCVQAGAHLSAIVMMGSILEGALLYTVEQHRATASRASRAPRNRDKSPRPIHRWGLSALIDVAHEVRWLEGDVSRFSHALRESRNVVHPYVQRQQHDYPDADTCAICWKVVRAAIADLLEHD